MADADPPHEIGDGKSPGHGNVDPPDTDAVSKQIHNAEQQDHQKGEVGCKAKEPGWVGRAGQDNRANLVRDCAEAMPGREVAWLLGRKLVRSFFNACRDLGRHGLDYLARCVRQIEFASLPLSLPWLANSLFSITASQNKVYA